MNPLRVAFDTGPLHGPKTGIGFAVEALHQALQARDDVLVRDYVLSFRAALTPGTTRLPLPAAWAHRAWVRGARPRVDRWMGDAQVVHGTNYVVPPSSLPTIVSVYDCWFLHHPSQASPTVRRAGDVLRAAIARGAVVHTSSHATQDAVHRAFPHAQVHTVHLGPLPLMPAADVLAVPELAERPFILAIGTVERRKNLPRLIEAFGVAAAHLPDTALVLAGGQGDDQQGVVDAIDRLPSPVASRVLLTGRVDEPVRSWLLHHASVLAYPSLDEGFGFPLLDAMQAGVPVVGSTAGSIPEVAGDAALLVEPGDVGGLAAALVEATTDAEVRARLIAAGDQRWKQFSWQRCAAEMLALYRRVVAGDTSDPT
jgi:glycosyltransferase involved in cell wall biosynthesis